METWHIIVLAIVQGITEFLPISSTAHLILLPKLIHWQDQGLAFDVALHVGSLLAVLIYFRQDLIPLLQSWAVSLRYRRQTPQSRLAWAIIIGTLPVGVAGLLLNDWVDAYLRSTLVIAIATIVFGILLGIADYWGKRQRGEMQIQWRDAWLIGLAQAVALIPGTSRSGITMTAGLMLGLQRQAAARFSFLLAIPVIVLAGSLETYELLKQPFTADWQALMLGVFFSGVSAYLCIYAFIRFLERVGMMPFVLYRLAMGGVLLLSWGK